MMPRFKRPEWNPAVKIEITVTMCLRDAIDEAARRLGYINRQDFITSVIREKLDELGFKPLMENRKHAHNSTLRS